MRIYRGLMLAGLAAVLTMPGAAFAAPLASQEVPRETQRRRRALPVGHAAGSRRLRSRWKAARPKRHANRLHISKRARRKHRRAA